MPAEKGRVSKRIRVNFNHRQLEAMETVFRSTQYPDPKVITVLAERLDIPMEKICTWFQNRRSKFRKESKKGHINWMREQFYGGPNSGQGCVMKPEGCFVNRGEGSPPANSNVSHVLTPPTTPVNQGCHPEYRIPTASVHHPPRPQWNHMTPPSPLHIQASLDNIALQGLPTPPPITMTTPPATTSDMYRNTTSMASTYSYSHNQNSYQQYETLLAACNPTYNYGDSNMEATILGNSTHARLSDCSPPLPSNGGNLNYDCATYMQWSGYYDRMYNGFGANQQQYNYNSYTTQLS